MRQRIRLTRPGVDKWWLAVETTADVVGCPACGTRAVATPQADHFLSLLPDDTELPPAVDLELAGNCSTRPAPDDVRSELETFLAIVESATGVDTVLYIGDDWEGAYPTRGLGDRSLWHLRFLRRPNVEGWTVWQVTGFAHVEGIGGNADLDIGREMLQTPQMPGHAVLVYVTSLARPEEGIDELEDLLMTAVETAGTGEFDGNESGPDGAVLYLYGPDADELWATVAPILRDANVGPGSYAIKRYGEPGAREQRVDFTDG